MEIFRRPGLDRRYPVIMLVAATAIGSASYLHLDGRIPLGFTTITGEHFGQVSVPEAILAVLLATGAVTTIVTPHRARTVARRVIGLAALGVLVGLAATLVFSPHIAADLAYHLSVLALLLAALLPLARTGTTA